MNKLVEIAIKKPYTFVVLSILILVFGALTVLKAPTDVFPNIQMPVSSVVWLYDGWWAAGFDQSTFDHLAERFADDFGGLRPFVVESYLKMAEQRISKARTALEAVSRKDKPSDCALSAERAKHFSSGRS